MIKNKKGVTLVELLAVVVILGIIATIGVLTIGNLIENQREKAAIAEWSNIKDAARLYVLTELGSTDDEFTLADIIENDFLGDYDGLIAIYLPGPRRSVTKITDTTQMTFNMGTGELVLLASGIEIDGILVEGEIPSTISSGAAIVNIG
jgi:prepilin-type N-terminal cleavage/methylation domain-containing protein